MKRHRSHSIRFLALTALFALFWAMLPSGPAAAVATPVAFRAVGRGAGNGTSASVTVPATVVAGDGLVLFVSINGTGSVSTPAGWTARGSQVSSTMRTVLLTKVAAASDAGSRVTVTLSQQLKADLVVAAYSGTDPDDPIHAFTSAGETTSRAGHTTPVTTATEAGTLAVSYWSDKSAATTSWTAPAGQVVRHTSFGSGGGRVSALLTDPGTPGTPGTQGGITATANSASDKATMWTVLLAPAQPAGNQPPTADFDVSCTGLQCDFNDTGSVDPDGNITSWAWNFGDGTTATEADPTHTFGSAGSYQVTLTVTDDNGATDTHTQTVTVDAAVATPVAFRAVGRGAGNGTSASVTVPATVVAGDGLVLFVSINGTGSVSTPAGWTARGSQVSSTMRTVLLTKVAAASDAGSRVTVTLSQQLKADLVVAAYSGTDPDDPIHAFTSAGETTSRAGHTTPVTTATEAGTLAVSYWSDKSAATTSWTAPAGQVVRHTSFGSGGGRVSALLTDPGTPGTPGTQGGITATANSASDKATMWTVLLAPAQPAGNQPPTADFDVSCTGLQCDFNDTGSVDPDGNITSWAWNFGDGTTATEADPTHTFGSAGSYQVTLTVTDDNGATDTHTQTVTVPPAEVVTITGAGDIASCNNNQPAPGAVATGRLLDSVVAEKPDATVIAIGDLAYDEGTTQQFTCAYHPTWGRHYDRTKPAVGNHEYRTPDAAGYFGYWNGRSGDPDEGWYSYDLGSWHVVVLNTNCIEIGGCDPGSPHYEWLAADLAANPASCTLVYGHHPYYTVGPHDRSTEIGAFWELAYDQGVDLWLVGHDHNYQRFAPQDPDGNLDPQRGIPQILVGSGGVVHTTPTRVGSTPNLVVENHNTYGIIEVGLSPGGYSWQFHPEAGRTFTDSGTGSCH